MAKTLDIFFQWRHLVIDSQSGKTEVHVNLKQLEELMTHLRVKSTHPHSPHHIHIPFFLEITVN